MFKKIVLIALITLPFAAFAQEGKIAYLNYGDVITAMPEYKQMTDSLSKSQSEFQAEFKVFTDDYTKKMSDYIAQRDSLNQSIRLRREQELQDLQQRADNFQQYAAQKQEELQQALVAPIHAKLQKIIEEVGKENNFLYIVNSQVFFFEAPNAINATPLVKKKLGIQ